MKSQPSQTGQQSLLVDQLRAGDSVYLDPGYARVIMVEKVDSAHVLVAYEGVDQIDYQAGTKVQIKKRSPIIRQHTLV